MAKARERSQIRLLGVAGRKRSDLLLGTALQATTLLVLSIPAWAQPAPNARPAGGSVVAGSAAISQTINNTAINQASQRAAIDWRSFNVGSQQQVTFTQPSSSAVALNRVTGPDPSQIAGKITANGQVVLVNQAGVTFYKGAQVNVQSLIVSSANVSNTNFMAGKMTFDQAGDPNARVVNEGTITVKQAGLAALVAPGVANSGTINARLGHVVLAGVKTATLDLYGDGLLALDVSNQVTKAPMGTDGKQVTALVTNNGVIRADGGTVQLTAAAADGVLRNLVQAGGTISANSVGARTGTVTVAGIGGSVSVTGVVSAAGTAANTTGGQIGVNATGAVTLASKARIDASGAAGGGTVAIGTTLQRAKGGPGTVPTLTAANVTIRKGASINANARTTGNGGRVVVLSGGTTRMNGTVTATGGSQSGDGGFVEVSGPNLGLTGSINLSASHGTIGTLLLDPTDLAIVESGTIPGSKVDGEFNSNTLAFVAADGTPLPSTINASTIENTQGNVVIQATGTIDVRTTLSVNNGLTIQAGGNLTIEPGATVQAASSILLQSGMVTPSGALAINAGVTAFEGGVTLIAGTGGIVLNGNISGGSVDLNATGGGVTQASGVGINATTLLSSNGVTGDVSLLGSNSVVFLGTFAVSAPASGQASFQMADNALEITGQVSAPNNVYLQASDLDGIFINPTGTVISGGRASFRTDSFFIVTNGFGAVGSVTAGTFELAPNTPGQTVTLGAAGAGLSLSSLANINAANIRVGAVTPPAGAVGPFTSAAAITVSGTFDALGRNLELDAGGAIDGTAGALINVATLSGTGGDWALPGTNTIANLGNVTAGSFSLNDGIGLTVTGALSGGTSATITDTGVLTVNGSVSGTAIDLSADSIDIPGLVTDGGAGTMALVANVGTISETGTLIAGVLGGSAVGVADLLGAGASVNQVATLGAQGKPITLVLRDFIASNFALRDGAGLTVTGTASATATGGQVFLASTAPAGITIAAKGAVLADASTGIASLQTDLLVNNAGVTANTIELAPATSGGTVTVGASGGGLSLPSMAGLSATNLVVGAVTQPAGGPLTTTAGAIVIGGAFTFTATGSLTLDAASSAGASGAVTQTAPLTGVSILSGTANSFTLTNSGNAIGTLVNLTATAGDVSVASEIVLAADSVSAAAGNVYLSSSAPAGVVVGGPVSARGRVGVQADAFAISGGSVVAGTFELAPATSGGIVTLGASPGGLSLTSLGGITAGTVRVGAVTGPGGGAASTTAGAVTIAATFDASATSTLELDASASRGSGAISQAAPLTGVGALAATGGNVTLANSGNRIAASSGIAAGSGNIVLVDSTSLALNGIYTGTNLFFEVAGKGGILTIGASGPATLNAAPGGRISLVADGLAANTTGSIGNAGGTVELAPFSSIDVSLAGPGGNGMLINAALLSNIAVGGGTLVIGGYTNLAAGGTTIATSAGAISFDGAVDLTGRANTLVLLANGAVSEPGGPLTVGTVTGVATGDFALSNPANNIQASTGIMANNGNVVVADDPTLQLTGTHSGNNLFFQVTLSGGSLALGDAQAPATLAVPTGGRISLVADGITATSTSKIVAPFGTLEVAPFSAIIESVQTTNLGAITSGLNTLVIGGYTDVRALATGPAASAGGVTLDGVVNLTTVATNLQLLALGSVTEPGGPLTVANVFGASSGTFSLANPANAIGQSLGITAGKGDVILVNGGNLTLIGTHSGANLFFEVASKGGTLSIGTAGVEGTPATLTAGTGGRITLVADQMTAARGSTLTAPGGTVELAPFSPLDISLPGSLIAGQLLIDPTLLASISPGLGTLTIGGFTNVPAGSTVATPSATSVTIGGTVTLGSVASTLDLEAIGAITQSAPLTGVGTLAATGGSVTLANAGNQISASSGITATAGDVVLVDGTSLTLNGVYSGNNLFFEVASKGGSLTIGASGPATLGAGTGARISLVADGLSANTTGSIGSAGGTVELAPFSPINVSLAGRPGGNGMLINAALLSNINVETGTLLIGGFTPTGTSTITTSAGAITLDGVVNLSGRVGLLDLLANGAVTEPGGPLNVATVTGTAGGGDFSLSNAGNQIQASTGMSALNGNIVLVDDRSLLLTGTISGLDVLFQITQAGGSLALGNGTAPVLLSGIRLSLVADSMTATAASAINAFGGTVELAPFSAINESVAGTNATGQLLIDTTLLSDIHVGLKGLLPVNTLVIGGYINIASGATIAATSARNVTLDGTLDLGLRVNTLELLANGSVTEPGGPAFVANIQGSAGTTFSLSNPANRISKSLGISAAKGDVVLVDDVDLTLGRSYSGNNLFFEVVRQAGTIQLSSSEAPATLTAAPGGRITLVADQITESAASSLSARGGTLELAPFSPINVSLAGSSASGQLLIDPTLLSIVTPGLSTLIVGGFTNVPGGATSTMASAGSITIDGPVTVGPLATTLNFEAIGAVTQSSPLVNVGTLIGTTGSTTLTNGNNSIGVLGNYTSGHGFALTDAANLLIAGTVAAGPSATFTINGALTETGGIVASRLSGSAVGTANLTGNNTVAELDSFGVAGNSSSFTLNPGGDLVIAGTVSANRIVVSAPSNQITLANGVSIVTGGATRPPGAIPPSSLLPANGGPGALLRAAGVTQMGRATVSGLGGGPSTLQISVTGNVRFDSSVGLSAPGAWLILTLTDGTATGDVFVKALDVSYSPGGSVNLFGSVAGVRGVTAAGLAFIEPTLNNRYQFNNCEIGSTACLLSTQSAQLLATETTIFVPVNALLAQVTPALILDPQDNDDLLELPVVSREDY
jgi:filamentous hemagglutinin family protein